MLSLFKPHTPTSPLLQAISAYQTDFDTKLIYSGIWSLRMVEVIARVEEYTDILNHCIRCYGAGVEVSKFMLGGESTVMSLGEFYLDKQGCYLDATTAHDEFSHAAVELLHLVHTTPIDTTTVSYNQRVTSHIIANLVELSTLYGQ